MRIFHTTIKWVLPKKIIPCHKTLFPVPIKCFTLWEPHFLGQYFAWDSQANLGFISFTSSCHKESFSDRKDYFQLKENISCIKKIIPCHKTLYPVLINDFLSQEIMVSYLILITNSVNDSQLLSSFEKKKSQSKKYFSCDK